jgi:hypothetical protein
VGNLPDTREVAYSPTSGFAGPGIGLLPICAIPFDGYPSS